MTQKTPKLGDVVKLHFSEECPESSGLTGTVTELDGDGYFDVSISSIQYGDYTYVDPHTDTFEIVSQEVPDAVNSPAHYKRGKFETIEVIEHITAGYDDPFTAYCVGNAAKYIDRAPYKHESPAECLRKAAWYLTRAADRSEAGG